MIGAAWIVLSIVIATCNAFDTLQCSPEWMCSCHNSHNGDIELHCPTSNDSAFIVNVQPREYIQTQCHNSPRWSDFHLSNLFPRSNVESVYFRMCGLPAANSSLGEIASKLGTENVEKLLFQSFGNLTNELTRQQLKGFPKLQRLILSSNGLTNLSSDLFADVPHLVWLDLRENNVRLSPGIFNNTPDLEVLELGNNMMERIEPGIFDPLTKLRLLNLWRNKFKSLQLGTFDKLTSLNSLDLNSNDLTILPRRIFAKLGQLEALNLFWNNFSSMPEGLFENNTKLRNVNLYGNKRNMTTLPRGLFANLTELRVVKLKGNGLITLPEDLFWGSASLENISLEHNYLTALPSRIFRDLHNLLELKLNYNELTSLPDEIFSYTTSLVNLDLSKNHFTSISRHLFSNLKSLRILNMAQNELKVVEDTSFNFLTNLRIAIFSDNQLTFESSFQDEYGKKSPFHHCTDLQELHLANNNISEIFGDWIISNIYLRVLDLKYNKIPFISTEDLQFLSNKIEVDLRHNDIKHIYLRNAEQVAKYQEVQRDVTILVDDNPIVCDCDLYDFLRYLDGTMHKYVQSYFHIIPGDLTCRGPASMTNTAVVNLKSHVFKCQAEDPCPKDCTCWIKLSERSFLVDCSYKHLTSIPHNIKTVLQYDLELNFTGNELTSISPLADIGLNNVSISELLLANNNISDISLDDLPKNLTVLELHNNNISKLSSDVLQFISSSSNLKTLTLHGNPWTCDCDAKDFLNFVQTNTVKIPNTTPIKCKNMNVSMLKMTATDLCPTSTMTIIGVSLAIAIAGLIISMLAAFYYRYQREIKVWLYAHQLCLWLVTEDELDKDKQYDAFISYSHKDEDFVVNELVSKLENGPRPFKLCLHFRDWLAGEWIPTQIARSVEDSRRTIVVLSPNFLESVWGRMEFRAAHCQALSEGRARVILILYGEIGPTDDLDPELKAYLSMNTYVKWGDPWFWDKLRYALPHPPELAKNTIKRKIFEKHQPCIQINGDKKELIYPVGVSETPPATGTPPAESLKLFICDEDKKQILEKTPASNGDAKFVFTSEELTKNNFANKVQCTTV